MGDGVGFWCVGSTAVTVHILDIFVFVSQEVIRSWAADVFETGQGSHPSLLSSQSDWKRSSLPPTNGWKHVFTQTLFSNPPRIILDASGEKKMARIKFYSWLYLKNKILCVLLSFVFILILYIQSGGKKRQNKKVLKSVVLTASNSFKEIWNFSPAAYFCRVSKGSAKTRKVL